MPPSYSDFGGPRGINSNDLDEDNNNDDKDN